MQAIRTRYHGATNTRGSRISAQCEAGRIYVPYNYSLNAFGNHADAAVTLLRKLGWPGTYAGGCFGNDYYWTAVIDYSEGYRDDTTIICALDEDECTDYGVPRDLRRDLPALCEAFRNIERKVGFGHLVEDK